MEKDEIKMEIKPTFKLLYEFIQNNALTLVILILLTIPIIQMKMILVYSIILVGYAVFIILNLVYKRFRYKGMNYIFYQDHLIYTDQFFHKNEIEIKYNDIKEIRYSQTFLERFFKIGTIIINTNSGNFLYNGIEIPKIDNLKENFDKMREVIDTK